MISAENTKHPLICLLGVIHGVVGVNVGRIDDSVTAAFAGMQLLLVCRVTPQVNMGINNAYLN